MTEPKSEVFQGTLDLMVLKTLEAMGPLHGYGIARRIEQLSEQLLRLNEGTVYEGLPAKERGRMISTDGPVLGLKFALIQSKLCGYHHRKGSFK